MVTSKNGKSLPRTSDLDLVIMLLQFIGKHINYSSEGDIAASEWQVIQKAVQSTTAYDLLKGFLSSNLPWQVVWKEDGGFNSQINLFLNELQADILEAMGWVIKTGNGCHRAIINDGVMLSSEAITDNLNQDDLVAAGNTVDFSGQPFRLEQHECRSGWLVTFTLSNMPASTEPPVYTSTDPDVDYDDDFTPTAEDLE